MAPLPTKQANLEKKNCIIIFFKETETDHFKWAISYETNGQKKKHLETPLINTQCSQLTRACDSRKLPVHHIITNERGTCLPKSPIESIHLASMR